MTDKSQWLTIFFTLSLLGVLLTPSYLQAANLNKIYTLAVNNDPELAVAQATYLAAKEGVPQARAGLLPNLSASGSTSSVGRTIVSNNAPTNNFNDHAWQVQLTQPIFSLSNWFQWRQAKNLQAQALAQFTSGQQALIFRVADSYLNILEAHAQLVSAYAERDAVKRQLEQVQQRFDVGLVAITDVLESTAAFDTVAVRVIEAENRQDISFEALLRLTGNNITYVNGLTKNFPIALPAPNDEAQWVQRALIDNYELQGAKEAVNAANKNLWIARSGHLPTIDAQMTYADSTSGAAQNFLGSDDSDTIIEQKTFSLRFNLPLYSGGATHSGAKQVGYQLQQVQRNFDLTQRQVVENTKNLFSAINSDVARVKARLRGIESSQSALEATETGYEVGTRNIVDVLLAQQRLYLAQFEYASARYRYIRNTLRLKQMVGSLSPNDIHGLNQFITEEKPVSRVNTAAR